MREDSILKSMQMVFSQDDMSRIWMDEEAGRPHITIDLHRLHRNQAKRLVKNVIALIRGGFSLSLIHGYRHGVTLKQMIQDEKGFSARVQSVCTADGNLGMTNMNVLAMA